MTTDHGTNQLRLDRPHGDTPKRPLRVVLPLTIGGLVALAMTGAGFAMHHVSHEVVWDRFDAVKPGILYRSGQLSSEQMSEAIRRYGIRTVVNFQVRDRSLVREESVVQSAGASFVNLPMPGDGFGDEEQFREVLKLVDDPEKRPVLVHCARGTCRTGAAVAMYRFERDGWTIDDVSAEMERHAYDIGWLSGYVFNMIKARPNRTFRDETSTSTNPPERVSTAPAETTDRTAAKATELRR